MAFPTSPTNGQTSTQNGILYTYASATDSWTRSPITLSNYVSNGNSNVNILTSNGNITMSVGGTSNIVNITSTGINIAGYANLSTGNLTANYITGTLTTGSQPNITSTGTLTSLTVTGVVTATAGGVKVGNIQDTSGTNTIQLSSGSITVTGNITAGGGGSGNVTATYFIGNGSQLTGLPASYSNTNVAAYLPTYTGNFTAGNVTGVTLVSATNLTGTLTTGAQPNITSTGTLTSVTVTANVTAGNIKSDNLLYANGTAWSLGSGLTFTANTTPPATGNVAGDQWLNTSANVLYEYINDGTGNYWIDVQTPTISSSSVTSTDSLSPFLLMGA